MKRYVYHKDSKKRPLTEEEIEQLKDFDGLRTNYQKALHDIHRKPIHKDRRLYFGLLLLLLIVYIILSITEKEENKQAEPSKTEQVEK